MPTRAARLRTILERRRLDFLLEAHNGLSARLVEEAGFEAIWASGLAISASLGVRDSNEASWTQVLDVLEFMADATRIPILVDGDTGYGNFNNVRRLVRKLEQCGPAGVCLEDKRFPKTNSFLDGRRQELADVEEFCGRLRAAQDSRASDAFVLVARTEAFIAGWGLAEALRRADAYRDAGADAILIHSAKRTPEEVLSFLKEWDDRLPVVVVPTKYYSTPTSVFREHGVSAVIWANHMMRAAVTAMQETARRIQAEESLVGVEETVAPLAEVFRLQGADELRQAEQLYLPRASGARAIVLAAARGKDMPELTADRPKYMVEVGGVPLLQRVVGDLRGAGIADVAVVRGYHKEAVDVPGVTYYDDDEGERAHEAHALLQALPALEGTCLVAYGDVLFRKFVVQELLEAEDDFAVFVDAAWHASRNKDRFADWARCSAPMDATFLGRAAFLEDVFEDSKAGRVDGEWMGFLKASPEGARVLRELLPRWLADPATRRAADMAALLRALLAEGHRIRVLYTTGNWLDVDTVGDALEAGGFR